MKMTSRHINQFLILGLFVILAIFLVQWIVFLPPFYQIFTIALCAVIAILVIVKPSISIDVKLLCFVCLGYALGGKGFAYISPFEPFYVSEVCLAFGLVALMFRLAGSSDYLLKPRYGLLMLFVFLAYSGLRLGFIDFPRFRMLAIRDAATAYYSLFVFTTLIACKKKENFLALKKMIIWMGPLALIGLMTRITGLTTKLFEVFPYAARIYSPHDDIASPLLAASAATAFLKGALERKPFFIFYALISVVVLSLSKTAGVFCLAALLMTLIIFVKRKEFMVVTIVGGLLATVLVSFLVSFAGDLNLDSDHLNTVTEISEFDLHSGNTNTTAWRLSWWRIVTEDTWTYNPLMGAGYGGDITTAFVGQVLGIELPEQHSYSRYPHNIFFTILGRLGFVVVIFFTFMQIMIYFRLTKIGRLFLSEGKPDYSLFMAVCFVIAGLANSFVQMTYEGPYAAIPHWVALGFVYAFTIRSKDGLSVNRVDETVTPNS